MPPPSRQQLSRDFEERVRPHAASLLRYVARLSSPGEAADVLQTALASALAAHSLRFRWVVVGAAAVLFAVSALGLTGLGRELSPRSKPASS